MRCADDATRCTLRIAKMKRNVAIALYTLFKSRVLIVTILHMLDECEKRNFLSFAVLLLFDVHFKNVVSFVTTLKAL